MSSFTRVLLFSTFAARKQIAMATKDKQIANNPEAYKAYLMEVMVALAFQDNQDGIITDPVLVAEKWGISPTDAISDIRKANNVLSAVKLFISKAVDDNWNWCEPN